MFKQRIPAMNPFWAPPRLGVKGGIPAGGGGGAAVSVGTAPLVAFDPTVPFVYPVYDYPAFTYPVVEAPVAPVPAYAPPSWLVPALLIGGIAVAGYFLTR